MTIPSPVVFCVNCRWGEAGGFVCERPKPEHYNLVTGERNASQNMASIKERSNVGQCGPAGLFFEERE